MGGWTITWQGRENINDEFPNSLSIFDAIKLKAESNGSTIEFSDNALYSKKPDLVIFVFGEDPYAEFQGDRENLDFVPNGFDVNKLAEFKNKGIPVVSVFLSGRPMWINPEINNSDAFIASWLPGSEGGGVSDLLFQTDPSFDFTGRLSFSWPSSAIVSDKNDPLFEFGYGLSYTKFQYNALTILKKSVNFEKVPSTPLFDIAFNICNVGNTVSDVSVLLFLSYPFFVFNICWFFRFSIKSFWR